MKIKAPEDVKEYIRSKFILSHTGEVIYRRDKNPQFGTCAKFNGNNYSKSYVKDVLEGRDPDLSVLFDKVDGKLFRNQDPVWSTRKGTEVTSNGATVCGVKVLNTGGTATKPVATKPVATKPGEPIAPDYYKAIEVPEHIKRLIHYKFKVKDGAVCYSKSEIAAEKTNLAGHRYSNSYILAVLKGEKPNLESLFTISKGCRIRNDDPVWGKYKNTKSTKSFYSICGETVPVKLVDPPIPRPDDFAWLADMVKQSDGTFSYKGGKPAPAHRIGDIIYSAGFIRRTKEGEVFTQDNKPPVPAYLFKHVWVPGNSPVIMTSDDETFWPGNLRLREILEGDKYIINSFIYTGEEIIRKVNRDESCVWDLDKFLKRAKEIYPEAEIVANIPLSDREETGEI